MQVPVPFLSENKTLYSVLELDFGAGLEEIKIKFRELAKKYHPDNAATGSQENFILILQAYEFLKDPENKLYYDSNYKPIVSANKEELGVVLPLSRVLFTNDLETLAKRGLMRRGLRNSDRKKFTGLLHDVDVLIKKAEANKRVTVRLPLTVRILCPECLGSDIFCECCGGKGNYKGTRCLQIHFQPEQIIHGKIYELDISQCRPEKFTHFKKKLVRVRLVVIV